uniref:DUF2232 domain-containing protein n=1 Tax=Magnetococcus massalia (strain MO-1) TaxID=451514 RepID=A0A1S7LCE9_MAGMO|nr:conserved membrane protein of unknown function [Candidatus Magnetococcus massalia]
MDRLLYHPAFAGILAALLAMTTFHVPGMAMVGLFIPLPIYLTGFRHGGYAAMLAAVIPLMMWLFSGSGGAGMITFLGLFLLMPILVTRLMRDRGWSLATVLMVGYLLAGGVLISLVALLPMLGVDFAASIAASAETLKEVLLNSLKQERTLSTGEMAHVTKTIDQMVRTMVYVAPFGMGAFWFFYHLMSINMSRLIMRSSGLWGAQETPITQFRLPQNWVWLPLLSGFTAWAGDGQLKMLAVNLAMFLMLPYLFQGSAVLEAWFQKLKLSGGMRMLFWITVFVFWLQLFLVMLALTGLFDTWFDFRRRMAEVHNKEG